MISTQKHRKEVYLGQNYKHPSVCHLDQLRKMANSEKKTQEEIFSPWNTLAIFLHQLLLVKQLFLLVKNSLCLSLLLRRFFPEIDQYLKIVLMARSQKVVISNERKKFSKTIEVS